MLQQFTRGVTMSGNHLVVLAGLASLRDGLDDLRFVQIQLRNITVVFDASTIQSLA